MKRRSKTKNITKIFIAISVIAGLAFAISNLFLNKKNEIVAAKINGEKIFKSDIDKKLRAIFAAQGITKGNQEISIPKLEDLPKEVIEILAKEVYLTKKLVFEAKKQKIDKLEIVQDKVDGILRQEYINYVANSKIDEIAISTKYNELTSEFAGKKEYLLSHILVKSEKEAKKLQTELKKPALFEKLASKYSIDKNSSKDGGKLGYVNEETMVKEISNAIKTLKKDEISNPIKTEFGWHLIKYSESREIKFPDYESVKENIREQLIQEAVNNVNDEIVKDAKIEILIKVKDSKKEESKTIETKEETVGESDETKKLEEELGEEKNGEKLEDVNKNKQENVKEETKKE